jgi:hypothetical protein
MSPRTATIFAAVIGALAPFRPFFVSTTDPATDTIDLILCPAYILGRVLPPMGDFGETIFFLVAILTNALLYGLVGRYICRASNRAK